MKITVMMTETFSLAESIAVTGSTEKHKITRKEEMQNLLTCLNTQ